MEYNYQIVFLGDIKNFLSSITPLFESAIRDLNLSLDSFKFITKINFDEYKGNQPAFCIYLGKENISNDFDEYELKKIIDDANPILPIYTKDNNFSNSIPSSIHERNGLLYRKSEMHKIVNLALESFSLLRSERKIFISYKRSDSREIAIQLYEELDKNNFDVFLDTHSIDKGDVFQDELWHRMSDCDVVLLLNTEGFLESHWCVDELKEAITSQIGIIQIVWPNINVLRNAELNHIYKLKNIDFVDKNILNDNSIKNIISFVESVRVRNLAARQDNLITEFIKIYKSKNKITLLTERYLIDPQNKRAFIPIIGVPKSLNYYKSENFIKKIKNHDIDEIYMLYDDLRTRKAWLEHLGWLDNYLKVKTLKKKDFESWVKNH